MESNFVRERITKLRMQKNVSEREMSLSLGKAHNYIHSIVSGKMLPTMDNFLHICDYFNITPLEFFDTELVNPVFTKGIYLELKRLCNNDMKKLLDILKIMKPSHFNSFIDFMESYKNLNKGDNSD